jgi:hypothetical protein
VPEAAVATEQGQYYGKWKMQEAVCHVIGLTIFAGGRLTFFKERVKLTCCLTFVIGIATYTTAELELEMTLGMCLWLKLKLAAITSPRATSTHYSSQILLATQLNTVQRHWWCLSAA